MKLSSAIEKLFKNFLPSPFTIALLLTLLTLVLAATLTTSPDSKHGYERVLELFGYWQAGLWKESLLAFAVQMMLMLVLGHVLALTKPVDRFVGNVTQFCTNTAKSASIVTFLTVLVSLFNWGLGLIFGAILARKVGEHAAKNNIALNYPLIGAAGYSGLMVWHGGISGSAPIKVADKGHIQEMMGDALGADLANAYPDPVTYSDTVFSTMNLVVMLVLLVAMPAFMYYLGKRNKTEKFVLTNKGERAMNKANEEHYREEKAVGIEKLDLSRLFSLGVGLIILIYVVYLVVEAFMAEKGFSFINPNFINLLLLGMGLAIHNNVKSFLKAVDQAIGGTSGILIQFPLYFGIIGLMTSSGLANQFSEFFVSISNEITYPIYTFLSAGIVNVFVPSGGGQWAVQGPILLQSASELGVSIPKAIMALAYGDQLTNMLQPFWALPLLGITGLKAKQILPYTVALMFVGAIIFVLALLIF